LFDDIEKRLNDLVKPETVINEIGKAKVLAVFVREPKHSIIGCAVTEGRVEPNSKANVYRNEELIDEGEIAEVQVGKQQVSDVLKGQECGIKFVGKTKFEEGDILEVYREDVKTKEIKISVKK
jgi:translation initiation factor IF-2